MVDFALVAFFAGFRVLEYGEIIFDGFGPGLHLIFKFKLLLYTWGIYRSFDEAINANTQYKIQKREKYNFKDQLNKK